MKNIGASILILTAAACSRGTNENSAICGLTHLASANKVLDQASSTVRALDEWPEGITGEIPVRVVGYGTGSGIVGETDDGIMIGFQGDGFPNLPGFGLAMVDDSSEAFRGILIFDMEVPTAFPQVGAVAGSRLVIPLYAFRINWSVVSDPKCPLFSTAEPDTADTP